MRPENTWYRSDAEIASAFADELEDRFTPFALASFCQQWASLLPQAKRSNACNSISEDRHTQSHDVNIIEDECWRVAKELDKIVRAMLNKGSLEKSTNQLRAAYFGQDRFWRRYRKLPKADGIIFEALESAQNDICGYQETLESMEDENHAKLNNEQMDVPDE
ncbi:GH11780 [Drosophila grimshawi]|uniref:GH11780 n=1 Tax=Drosophila grimshawi TaxID=7222 RepID=B4K0J0_DROGR|nr:GH11780 [Drosophila grimshawi]